MQAVVPPITGKYSEDIKDLLMKLLRREPNQRPSINEVMAEPLLINILMDLPMTIGKPQGVRSPLCSITIKTFFSKLFVFSWQ